MCLLRSLRARPHRSPRDRSLLPRRSELSVNFGARQVLCAALVLALPAMGCSRSPTVLVVGTLTHEGKPLEGATITFLNSRDSGLTAAGVSDANGHYSLHTYITSDQIVPGALPDEYRVIVEKYKRPEVNRVLRRMASLQSKGQGKLVHYMTTDAIHDLWPEGIPDGWPPGYIPGVTNPPAMPEDSFEARRLRRLNRGIPLIPRRYASVQRPVFRADVERTVAEPLVFNFDLTGDAAAEEREAARDGFPEQAVGKKNKAANAGGEH